MRVEYRLFINNIRDTKQMYVLLSSESVSDYCCNAKLAIFFSWIKLHSMTEMMMSTSYYTKILMVMVFNATFNNISIISWQSFLLLEETRVSGENHRPAASHWQTLSHNVASSKPRLSEGWTHSVSGDRHWLHRQ